MTSNARSVPSETRILGLRIPTLRMAQVVASGDHVERIYGFRVSPAGPKQSKLIIHLYVTYGITMLTRLTRDPHKEVPTINEE